MKSRPQKETQYFGPIFPLKTRSPLVSGKFSGSFVFILYVFLVITIFSKTAHAGLISFVNSLVGGQEVEAKNTPSFAENSQTMVLLSAAINSDPNPDRLVDTVPVMNGETLVPDLASSNIGEEEGSGKISTYIVRKGDTISEVAKMFNVSVSTVLWANNLTSKSVLKPGQNLIILPVSGISYTIAKNDTVSGIAKRFNADADDIYRYNDLNKNSLLIVGQKIIIPDAEMSTISSTPSTRIKVAPYEPLIVNVNSLPSYPGYFSCPLQTGRISQKLHGRNAIDLAAPVGTPIYSSAAGTVIIAKSNGAWNGGYGNFVVISHPNGSQTLYAHMSKSIVYAGESVGKGETIGYIGMTGLTTGPHIHFEIRGAKNPFVNSCE